VVDEVLALQYWVPELHTCACGDFILIDRDSWARMRGSPELVMFSFHLDSLTLLTAYREGVREFRFAPEAVHYHIEHGSGWTPEQSDKLTKRMQEREIRVLSDSEYRRFGHYLLLRPDYFLSTSDWGLAAEELPESTVTQRTPEYFGRRQSA
jgi:hypothetical protein